MNFSLYIAKRYVFSNSNNNAINIINRIASLGIIVGAMALFVVLSVFSGLKVFSLSFTARYKTEEIESFHSLDEAFIVLAPYMNNPFLTALLFTTENDITFKLNKKRVGSIIEQAPTFKNASDVILEMKEKGL